MIELGMPANSALAAPVIGTKYSKTPGPTKAAASGRFDYDDRAAAAIQNPFRSELTQFATDKLPDSNQLYKEMQANLNSGNFSLSRLQEEFVEALRSQAKVDPTRAVDLLKSIIV